jgi:hypothetical protein
VKRRVVGWEGIVGEDDQPLPYTPENLDALLSVPYLYQAIAAGLTKASIGAPVKNSRPGSDGTPAPTGSAQATAAAAV